MRAWSWAVVGALVVLLIGGVAQAISIYLNGVRIDGVRNQTFEKATVQIDAQGDVHIKAEGYSVEGGSQAAPASPAATAPPVGSSLTRRYFLVTEKNYPGQTQYEIDVYINSKWIRRLRAAEDQIVVEITDKLKPGNNHVLLHAVKKVGAQRLSFSKHVFFRVIIGEGNASGTNVMIDNPLVTYERTAHDTEEYNDEFNLNAR